MRRGRENNRRKANRRRQRPREEIDLVKEKEMERAEREAAELRAMFPSRSLPAPPSSDLPPILGEPDSLVRAPLKPKPHTHSGAIALPEPETEDAFFTVNPKSISK